MDLNDAHKAQLTRFVQFFKGKRDRTLIDREAEKEDFKSDRMPDDGQIFTKPEAESLLETYHQQMMGQHREDLEKTTNLAAVYVSQLFAQAENVGMDMYLDDISMIEDQSRLGQVSLLAALQDAPPLVPKPRAALPSLAAGGAANVDPAVFRQLQEMEEANRQMTERYQLMQAEVATLLKERTALSAENEEVKVQLNALLQRMHQTNENEGAIASQIEHQLAETNARLQAQKQECDNMRYDLNQRLNESSQFRELKALLKKKSDQNKMLRQHMAAHGIPEPQVDEGHIELTADDD
eukprot:TRINITY_DN37045_c0_g1_i1.p2 TRINITY_DN37045_c0_g1~~TRINITY_DN37045_c0_g1_i1.p2  ORF type:complete len:316 (-),score=103.69 TRINITY_DN37045_c0_g1_i1:240-1124(-)